MLRKSAREGFLGTTGFYHDGQQPTPAAQASLAALVAAAFALLCASGIPGLGDTDPYSHIEYARQLVASGFRLRGHPFLPWTILGDSGVDLWLGFHWLLVPFAPLGVLWGARVAGAAVAAAAAAGLAWALTRQQRATVWPFAVAPLLLAGLFALRGHVARPAHLTIPLLIFELLAGAGELPAAVGAGAAFAHGLLHLSAPLSPAFAGLGWLAARLRRQTGSPRAVLWSVGALALALVLRPDRDLYTVFAVLHNLQALGYLGPQLPYTGSELLPMPLFSALQESAAGFALIGVAAWLGRGRERRGSPAARTAALLAVTVSFVLMMRTRRFEDYLVPTQALAAGLLWPRERISRRWLAALAAGAALLAVVRVHDTWAIGRRTPGGPSALAEIAAAVRSRVPPGEILFTDTPFLAEVLYSALPDYRYVLMYDPAILHLASPERFWRWANVVAGARDAKSTARAVRSFGASWAVTSARRGGHSLQETMGRTPALFELADFAPDALNGLYLWRLK